MPARVNCVPKKILTQKLTLYKQKRGVFERFLVKKRFKPILDTGDSPRCPKKKKWALDLYPQPQSSPLTLGAGSMLVSFDSLTSFSPKKWTLGTVPSVHFGECPTGAPLGSFPQCPLFRRGSFQRRPVPAESVPRCPGGSPLPGSCPSWGEWPDAGA